MTWSLDENVGKVIDKLEQEGLTEQTLIFFLSDNGGALSNQSNCEPLKGLKENKFEGGHRVSFFITWPGTISGGETFDVLTSSLDIFKTSFDIVGLKDYKGNRLDGVNLLPYLTGKLTGDPHESLYWRKDKMAAARVGSHKLIRLADYGYRMYNLEKDISESRDLFIKDPEKGKELVDSLSNWETQMIEPLWYEEEDWNNVTYEIHRALMENRNPNYKTPGELKKYLEDSTN